MRKIVSLIAVSVLLIANTANASFPVSGTKTQTNIESSVDVKNNTSDDIMINDVVVSKRQQKLVKRVLNKVEKKGGIDTELIITLLLWFFLGFLAAHRWYAQKPIGWNILFILTLGGLGIWALVDLINILTGNW